MTSHFMSSEMYVDILLNMELKIKGKYFYTAIVQELVIEVP